MLVVYLGTTGILLVVRSSAVGWSPILLHAGLLAAVAIATWMHATPRWLRSWAPLIVLIVLYSELPALIRAAGHAELFDGVVVNWEQALFGSQPARTLAAQFPTFVLSETLHAAYLSYYAIIVSVPAALFLTRRYSEFHEAVFVLMVTFTVCFAAYIAFPVAGPRYLWTSSSPHGGIRSATLWLLDARSSKGTAFPSSHVAVSVTQSVLAVRYFGARRGVLLCLLTLGLGLGAIYGGFHYAIDVIAGACLAPIATFVALAVTRSLRDRGQAKARAPT